MPLATAAESSAAEAEPPAMAKTANTADSKQNRVLCLKRGDRRISRTEWLIEAVPLLLLVIRSILSFLDGVAVGSEQIPIPATEVLALPLRHPGHFVSRVIVEGPAVIGCLF